MEHSRGKGEEEELCSMEPRGAAPTGQWPLDLLKGPGLSLQFRFCGRKG